MARHFPVFIDLGGAPPLVVGTDPALAAKLRLLGSFAPQIDLLTGRDAPPPALDLPGVRHIRGIPVDRAAARFSGRSLIVIGTGDQALDERLSRQAREIGVPVNVPDKPALCSAYFGSIVDRDPVILAISTGGHSPVLAQRLRAVIEDRLPPGYGRIAAYLDRIRHRLRHLSAATRRRLQHRIIDGDAAGWIINGEEARADSHVVDLLAEQPRRECGQLHVVPGGTGDPAVLGRRQTEAIRNADVILHPPGKMPEFLHLARREVELLAADPAMARAHAASMTARGLEVVMMQGACPVPFPPAAEMST